MRRREMSSERPSKDDRAYWIIVESLENHSVDEDNGFTFFGLPSGAHRSAESVKAGDLLFAYVASGVSAFADVRKVVGGTDTRGTSGRYYDRPFAFSIK